MGTLFYCLSKSTVFDDYLKDRQQEARAVLVGSRYIGDHYVPLKLPNVYDIPLTTLLSGLFIDIKHVKFTGSETKRA